MSTVVTEKSAPVIKCIHRSCNRWKTFSGCRSQKNALYAKKNKKVLKIKTQIYSKKMRKQITARVKQYRRTVRGYIRLKYMHMLQRVKGTTAMSKKYPQYWQGKSICDRESFYLWSVNNPQFLYLYRNWVENGYNRQLSPSIDRIDSAKGYALDNIQWITTQANSEKAGLVLKSRKKALKKILVEGLVKKYA